MGAKRETALRLDAGQIEVMDGTMAEVLRQKTHEERLRIGFEIWESARRMLTAHLSKAHPG